MRNSARVVLVVAAVMIALFDVAAADFSAGKGLLSEKSGKVKIIRVDVEQSYDKAPDLVLPIDTAVRRILESQGFTVVGPESDTFDAQLSLSMTGKALSEKYFGGFQYSGARVQGEVRLGLGDSVWWSDSFEGSVPPPEFIFRSFKSPSDAPFAKAYEVSGLPLTIYAAAYALGVERSLDGIIGALKDREPAIRCKALDELGKFQVVRALPDIRSLIGDSAPIVRIHTLQVLALYKDKSSVGAISTMLNEKNVEVRQAAAMALGEVGDPGAVRPLIAALRSDGLIRKAVAGALEKIGEPSVMPLIGLLRDRSLDGLARETVIETLGDLGDPRATDPLIQTLGNSDAWSRAKTVDALFKIGNNATYSLCAALKDPEPLIREGAAEVLGMLKACQSFEPMLALLKDPVAEVRARAAWALGEIGDERASSSLKNLAEHDPESSVRNSAQWALDKIDSH